MKTRIILLGHGSQAEGGNEALAEIARMVMETGGLDVSYAYLQFCKPTLRDAVGEAAEGGVEKILVLPFFLYEGNHVLKDIPGEVETLRAEYPDVSILLTKHLGVHSKLAEIVLERIKENISF